MSASDICPNCAVLTNIGECPKCGWLCEWRVKWREARNTGRRGGPRKRKIVERGGRPRIVERVESVGGPIAMVECPECRGGGCGLCVETGKVSLYRWHLWKSDC